MKILLNKMKKYSRFFTDMRNFMLILTFFSLWIATYFREEIENLLAFILIMSIGILHGTNDIKLIEKGSKKKVSKKILYSYLLFLLIGVLLFYFMSQFALLVFILFSAYHFGEQHWTSKFIKRSPHKPLLYIFYGMVILGVLFLSNNVEVTKIIHNITGINISKNVYLYTSMFSFVIFFGTLITCLRMKLIRVNIWEELFYLLLFYVIFNTASLLWAFAIYFIFWHSIPSLADQVYFLYGNYKRENFIKYLKSSLLQWTLSIIGLITIFIAFQNQDRLFISIFFTSIAAITFPHVWIMSKLNK
ncbi:Brp/Blh family beta-carotene 15,15'-dioxygenase [Aquimarina litoralis]|uniref:Brp/Blh family beta-carotene 15,15'-dioxygenase n=1 Tax=Aquimarina litoralis TaxID=584605 RepID=UPI0031CEA476